MKTMQAFLTDYVSRHLTITDEPANPETRILCERSGITSVRLRFNKTKYELMTMDSTESQMEWYMELHGEGAWMNEPASITPRESGPRFRHVVANPDDEAMPFPDMVNVGETVREYVNRAINEITRLAQRYGDGTLELGFHTTPTIIHFTVVDGEVIMK